MSALTGNLIRQKYLEYFKKRKHIEVPSAPLVPQNDPTTLFTSSGMQPMISYFLGEPHPEGTRIVDSQRCFRAEDIEEVGDNRHTTAFEMLGNWSLGDYFKKEQLNWFFDFLTNDIQLNPQKLYVSVFSGNNEVPRDDEAIEIWKEIFARVGIDAQVVNLGTEANAAKVGMQGGRIFLYSEKKNWWSRSGAPAKMPPGEPGGPDSEVFYEYETLEHDLTFGEHCHPNCDCGRYGEIGNSVFMQYQKQSDGSFKELAQKNIDFGGGLERILAANYNNPDVFLTDLFWPIIQKIEELSHKSYHGEFQRAYRIIADHIKAAVWLASDGVIPSNKAQGYMMRRLVRRAVSAGRTLGLDQNFTYEIIPVIQKLYADLYPQVEGNEIVKIISEEENKFRKTLENAIPLMEKIAENYLKKWREGCGWDRDAGNPDAVTLSKYQEFQKNSRAEIAKDAFDLYQSNGVPEDVFIDMLMQKLKDEFSSLVFSLEDREEIKGQFKKLKDQHAELSRTASAGMFKGGLADQSEIVTQYHTATHLVHQALRTVLGEHVFQRGSNITAERLRFDFSHQERLTEEQKKQVEDIVNEKMKEKLPVYFQIMPLEIARKTGAIGLFGEKYPDTVKVYTIGPRPENTEVNTEIKSETEIVPREKVYSREFCGGPHVDNTGNIHGTFKVQKDEKIAKDVVRIKGILEK